MGPVSARPRQCGRQLRDISHVIIPSSAKQRGSAFAHSQSFYARNRTPKRNNKITERYQGSATMKRSSYLELLRCQTQVRRQVRNSSCCFVGVPKLSQAKMTARAARPRRGVTRENSQKGSALPIFLHQSGEGCRNEFLQHHPHPRALFGRKLASELKRAPNALDDDER
jgi:hypothetical protein